MSDAQSLFPDTSISDAAATVAIDNASFGEAVEFIKTIFGPVTESPVWIQSLGNPGTDEKPKHVATRDLGEVAGFIAKWDRDGRGAYFCPSTIGGIKRIKENVSETIGLWSDIDFKDTDEKPDDILRKLKALRYVPSRIHATGNGFHCFWLFKEALTGEQDRLEAALKLLADLVAGDMAVTQVVALMRIPGTHNSKHGKWLECETIHESDARYELDDLEEWLAETSPVILRKNRPAIVTDNNPFLEAARALGFKPSIDVEKRLAGMSYMGGGNSAIHSTQLAVSASLLKSGTDINETVSLILDATKGAAASYGERWHWQREEKAIRKMCTDWLKKHPPSENRVTTLQQPERKPREEATAGGEVVALAPRRATKASAGGIAHHVILGGAVLATLRDRGEDMLVTAGEVWRYHDGLWTEADEGRWLEVELETGAVALDLPSTIKLINEARKWLLRRPELYRTEVAWDSHGKIPTRSGLLDIHTLELEPARPEHLATWRIECDYNSNARCPWWETMLDDFFGDRPAELRDATKATLQEILGAGLMENKARALTRALVLEGPSEAGKTRILDVLSGLFCDRPIATPLDVLGGTHGLMEFRRRAPWVLHEAFNAGQWHLSSVVKSILTGDPVQINIKNGAIVTQRIKSPVFWGTNHPPQFKEATKAIVNRMIVIKCRTVFDPKNLVGAAAEGRKRGYAEPSDFILKEEKSGLLNWAVEGLRRALARGHIEITAEVAATMETVRQDSNIVAGFLDECADYSADAMVSVPDFCAAFSVWWGENKGEDRRTPSNESIGRAMTALGDNRIATDGKELRDNSRRYYGGLHLNSIGLDYWSAASGEGLAKGKTARTSPSRNEVNRLIPNAWHDRPAIVRLRKTAVTVSDGSRSVTVVARDSTPRF
jgi:P4 family phage/plasmid primase-like protien